MSDSQNKTTDCTHCRGLGFHSLPPRKCFWCGGRGYFEDPSPRERQIAERGGI